jgi:hypothetical protein
MILFLICGGNVLNFPGHLYNVARGYSPQWFGEVAGVSVLIISVIVMLLYRGMDSEIHAAWQIAALANHSRHAPCIRKKRAVR